MRFLEVPYDKIAKEVSRIASLNSNPRARAMTEELDSFLDGLDSELENIALAAQTSADETIRAMAPETRNLRVSIVLFRNYLYRYGTATADADIDRYEKRIGAVVGDTNAQFEAIIKRVGPENSAAMADVYKRLVDTAVATFTRMIPIVRENSNTRALEYLNSAGASKFAEVSSYLGQRLRQMDEAQRDYLQRANDTAAYAVLLMLIVTAVALVVGLATSYVMISRIARSLRQIIGSLDDSSSQVNAAAGQISDSS